VGRLITKEELDRIEKKYSKELQEYLSYEYPIIIDKYKDYWFATIAELPGCDGYGPTPDEAVEDLELDKKNWFLLSFINGIFPPKPKKQQQLVRALVRMPVDLHLKLSQLAAQKAQSINSYIVSSLQNSVSYRRPNFDSDEEVSNIPNKYRRMQKKTEGKKEQDEESREKYTSTA